MIENILKLLNHSDYFNVSDELDIAKGKYKIPLSINDAINQFKRDLNGKEKNN